MAWAVVEGSVVCTLGDARTDGAVPVSVSYSISDGKNTKSCSVAGRKKPDEAASVVMDWVKTDMELQLKLAEAEAKADTKSEVKVAVEAMDVGKIVAAKGQ
jgi:16S rRNA G1207 methylase RsmC